MDKAELVRLLKVGHYDELNRRLIGVQNRYEAGQTDDHTVNAAFGAFARADPGLGRKLDSWVEQHPKIFVPYLARAIHQIHMEIFGRSRRGIGYGDLSEIRMTSRNFGRVAIRDIEQAISMNKRLPTAYATMIIVHAIDERFGDALTTFRAAQAALPSGTYHLLLLAHFSKGSYWGDTEISQRVFLIAASVWRYFDRRYKILDGYSDYVEATSLRWHRTDDPSAEHYNRAIAVNKNVSWYYVGRARNHLSRGRDNAALKDLLRAMELEHQSPRILGRIARIYSRQNKHNLALKYIEQTIVLNPYNPRFLVIRARILRQMKQFEKAKKDLKTALVYGKNYPEVHAERARFFEAVDRDRAKATGAWRRAVELAPYKSEHLKSYLLSQIGENDCQAVRTAVRYLGQNLSRTSRDSAEILSTSTLVNRTIRTAQCPYEDHHVATQFRYLLTPEDRKRLDSAKMLEATRPKNAVPANPNRHEAGRR